MVFSKGSQLNIETPDVHGGELWIKLHLRFVASKDDHPQDALGVAQAGTAQQEACRGQGQGS